ncbi:hypothetical protein [Halomarina pelagica]|uniref:hypothetical protein n=1 Tax=Halomarina pelagica TaxID=2961599 RepID=UPI0020C4D359|nr:hypothetical protein [Halomarina sp. BND7]
MDSECNVYADLDVMDETTDGPYPVFAGVRRLVRCRNTASCGGNAVQVTDVHVAETGALGPEGVARSHLVEVEVRLVLVKRLRDDRDEPRFSR